MSHLFDFIHFGSSLAVITDKGELFSYQDLERDCSQLSSYLQKGNLAVCLCENQIGSIVGYCSFIRTGVPVIMLDGSKDKESIVRIISFYRPKYFWLPTSRLEEFGRDGITFSIYTYSLVEYSPLPYTIHPDVLLLLTTSGSTGSPKLVKLTKKNIRSNAASIVEYLKITKEERPVTSLPMHYSFGLSVINSHLMVGATLLLTDKGVVQREFWDFARNERASSLSGVPYTFEMLKRLRFFRMKLPDMKTLCQAGGKLNALIVKEFINESELTDRKFFVMYGQTEATARMSYLPWNVAAEKYSSIGVAIPGGKFSIIDTDGKEITAPDVDGELVYEGPNVSLGYAECIADLAKGDENHGILHTGDIARKDKDGYYYITGRMKRFVKLFGNRCNLDGVEQMVKEVTTNCACTGVDDKLTVFVTEDGLEEKIVDLLIKRTGINKGGFAVKRIDEIPKNASGKIQYTKLNSYLN